ncbi:unnamed protein product [Prunus brigantina]
MCLHAQEDQSVGGHYCNQLQLCRPQRQSILHWPKLERKQFGLMACAIHLATNQVFSGRSKQIEARYHRIRNWVES